MIAFHSLWQNASNAAQIRCKNSVSASASQFKNCMKFTPLPLTFTCQSSYWYRACKYDKNDKRRISLVNKRDPCWSNSYSTFLHTKLSSLGYICNFHTILQPISNLQISESLKTASFCLHILALTRIKKSIVRTLSIGKACHRVCMRKRWTKFNLWLCL